MLHSIKIVGCFFYGMYSFGLQRIELWPSVKVSSPFSHMCTVSYQLPFCLSYLFSYRTVLSQLPFCLLAVFFISKVLRCSQCLGNHITLAPIDLLIINILYVYSNIHVSSNLLWLTYWNIYKSLFSVFINHQIFWN